MAVSRQAALLGRSAGTAVLSYRGAIPQRRLLAGCFSKSAVRWQTSATSRAKPDSSSSRTEPVVFELPTRYPMVSGQADAMFRPLPRKSDFPRRHIGPDDDSIKEMLAALSPAPTSLEEFVKEVIPADILSSRTLFPEPREKFTQTMAREGLDEWEIQAIGKMMNRDTPVITPMIGQGYYRTHVPEVIKRNILESPAWYTSYTPYQPEISQGRLESLLNFQTMVSDLTALPISNASLLDEGTAAAEAMTVSLNSLPASRAKREGKTFVVSSRVYLQTLNVLRGRAEGLGVRVLTLDLTSPDALSELESLGDDLVGVLVQYPDNLGEAHDFRALADAVHKQGALLSAATDLLALTLLTPPGEWGADIAFGNAQRLGVPLGNGGPHAAFFATKDSLKRKIPGRLIGVSKDRLGGRALRLALQTREQHIRREKATSNVCTAQALLANMSAMYAVYHGPEGLKHIAERCHTHARVLAAAAQHYGFRTCEVAFDTVAIDLHGKAKDFQLLAHRFGISIKVHPSNLASVSIDETTTEGIIVKLSQCFAQIRGMATDNKKLVQDLYNDLQQNGGGLSHLPKEIQRQSSYLAHPVFNSHHSETEMLRYIHHLQSKDLSLVHSMIPLGSCTMKLNGSTEMSLITLPWASDLHPHDPAARTSPIGKVIRNLSLQLADITGMEKTWLQPNSGAQGEFAGLRVIRKYHEGRGDSRRDICLIPVSAHGTNPASAAMAGMRVVPIKCDAKTGNLDLADLEAKCQQHADHLGAIMITYPSTFGVFEPRIKKVCELVHQYGGQVYMDGANMNAQIGLCSPGEIGADVCHLNLHKTFCIPHGGGGPGVGPICVKEHLAPFLPKVSPELNMEKASDSLPVSSAIYGSASILPISWSYNAMMGGEGLKKATEVTLLNANYLLSRLKDHYPILYTNEHGRCAHEFILDVRPFHTTAGIEAIDIAKRLQDYGFHAPTMSWPVANTLMIEPTESESKEELDRFVDALVSIREEIREIEEGRAPREGNVLKMAPHPLVDIIGGDGEDGAKWDRPYSRTKAAYPLPWLKEKKFWPSVARVNDTYGDLNLFCTCPPVEDTTGGNLSSVQASI